MQLDYLQLVVQCAGHEFPGQHYAVLGEYPDLFLAVQIFDSAVAQPKSDGGQWYFFHSAVFDYALLHLSAKCHLAHFRCFQQYGTAVVYAAAPVQHVLSEIQYSIYHSNLSRNVVGFSALHCHLDLDFCVLPVGDMQLAFADEQYHAEAIQDMHLLEQANDGLMSVGQHVKHPEQNHI